MIDLIVNPIAGGKNGKNMQKNLSRIESRLKARNVEYKLHFSEQKGDVKALAGKLIEEGAKTLVCVGGDGSFHELINGITDFTKVNVGLIPCGTGNDFASAICLPKDPEAVVDLILDSKPKFTDFMELPTVRCINIAGLGIDVDVLKRYEALPKKTKFGYTKCLIKTLFNFDFTDFDATLNGKTQHFRSFIACAANGTTYGGGIPICPVADPTDHLIDFVAVSELKGLKIVGAFLKLKKGKLLTLKQSYHERAAEIEIKTDIPCTVNVDGELYDNIPFKVKVVPDTLKMFRP